MIAKGTPAAMARRAERLAPQPALSLASIGGIDTKRGAGLVAQPK